MFRDRILQWSRVLNPLTQARVDLKFFTEKHVHVNAFSQVKKISIDQKRVEFYLNVSRAYIKLAQVAR
jgi:hypothetical protein